MVEVLALAGMAILIVASVPDMRADENEKTAPPDTVRTESGSLVGGVPHGTWDVADMRGTRRELGNYFNGRRTGIWTYWNADSSFNRVEHYPPVSNIDLLGILETEFGPYVERTGDWRALTVAAGFLFQNARLKWSDNRKLKERALAIVNRSIEIEPHYWNYRMKAFILQTLDFKAMQEATQKAIEYGKKEIPGFEQSEEYRTFKKQMESAC